MINIAFGLSTTDSGFVVTTPWRTPRIHTIRINIEEFFSNSWVQQTIKEQNDLFIFLNVLSDVVWEDA